MKIIVFILNALIHFIIAACGFIVLIIGMNGYSESQAAPGLIFYIVLSIVSTLGLSTASAFAAHRLNAKSLIGKFGAAAIALTGFAIIGGIITIIGFFAAIFLAEALR